MLGWSRAYSVVDVKDPAPMIDDTVAVVNVLSSEDVASFVALVYDPFAACSTFGGLAPRQAFSFWEVDVWVFGSVEGEGKGGGAVFFFKKERSIIPPSQTNGRRPSPPSPNPLRYVFQHMVEMYCKHPSCTVVE